MSGVGCIAGTRDGQYLSILYIHTMYFMELIKLKGPRLPVLLTKRIFDK
jgi:hypothetical protein